MNQEVANRLEKLRAAPPLRRAQSCGPTLPVPSYPRPDALPPTRRSQSRRTDGRR
jgi:hypothetical protein